MSDTLERLFDQAIKANGPGTWGPDIAAMTMESLTELGFDREGNLFFGGEKLKIVRRFSLTSWQTFFAGVTATGVFLAGLAAIITAVAAALS